MSVRSDRHSTVPVGCEAQTNQKGSEVLPGPIVEQQSEHGYAIGTAGHEPRKIRHSDKPSEPTPKGQSIEFRDSTSIPESCGLSEPPEREALDWSA